MEGLLIAEQLRRLSGGFPYTRSSWSFPDERTAVLPLASGLTIVIRTARPAPGLEVTSSPAPPRAGPRTAFQRQLAARAGGDLEAAEQLALDRVVRLSFAASGGFVPEPPVTLVAELTGKNANLVLLDERDTIIGVERPVTSEHNRFRQLRTGLRYVPPPPYAKLDPRAASLEELRATLDGKRLTDVRNVVDGIGPRLQAALVAALKDEVGASGDSLLEAQLLDIVVAELRALVEQPARFLQATGVNGRAGGHEERPGALARRPLERSAQRALTAALRLARRRVADAERALADEDAAARLRAEADLLLATGSAWRLEGSIATLEGLDGEAVRLEVDPSRDAAGNAQLRYDRARRREARRERAAEQLPGLRREVTRLERLVSGAEAMTDEQLAALTGDLGGAETRPDARRRSDGSGRATPGVRFTDPRGFEVVVGRNARENDAVTFQVARSRDVWLHAQGYRGAHVVIRSGGASVPFETVLFAARLAAGFSEARHSSNVPVDYTERKNVWRVKGAPPGTVNFTQQKTVYVDPARDDAAAEGSSTLGPPN